MTAFLDGEVDVPGPEIAAVDPRASRYTGCMVARLVLVLLVLSAGLAHAHQDKYPMPAATYKKRVEQRLTRYKERLEKQMEEHKLAAAKRDAARKRLGALGTELRKLADQFGADDTITLAEAETVKARGKTLREALYRDLGFAVGKGQ